MTDQPRSCKAESPSAPPSGLGEGGQQWFCRACGIVRVATVAPWCRHNDPEFRIAASRMVSIPAGHPLRALLKDGER
jgi:hypothetical protein